MSLFSPSENCKTEFINLCNRINIISPLRSSYTNENIKVPILNHDKLWQYPDVVMELSQLIIKMISESSLFDSCNSIISINSLLGTYGMIPLSPLIAYHFLWEIFILKEYQPGEFKIYPNIGEVEQYFENKVFFVFTDGIIRGLSLSRAESIILNNGGRIGGIFMLTNVNNQSKSVEMIIENYPSMAILTGKELNLFRI